MKLYEKHGMRKYCPGWTSGLKAMSLLMMAFVAMTFSSTVLAQGVHGITFLKGCTSPTEIGAPYECRYGIGNVGGDTGNGGVDSVDTVTFHSITDVTHAGVEVSSGEILPLLILTDGNDVHVPGTECTPAGFGAIGNTECTLPPGGIILSETYSYYTAQLGDPDPLSDTATLLWFDTCNSDANNCPLGEQTATASSQSALTCGTDCDDGDACTADSCDEVTNECVNGPPTDCDDADACTDDSCDPATGLCVNAPNFDCDDLNACTDDSCDPATGLCVNVDNIDCDDLNVCTDDSCDPVTGLCVNVENGLSCEPIPTLSVGGLVAMILTMLGLGGILIRRRLLRKSARV